MASQWHPYETGGNDYSDGLDNSSLSAENGPESSSDTTANTVQFSAWNETPPEQFLRGASFRDIQRDGICSLPSTPSLLWYASWLENQQFLTKNVTRIDTAHLPLASAEQWNLRLHLLLHIDLPSIGSRNLWMQVVTCACTIFVLLTLTCRVSAEPTAIAMPSYLERRSLKAYSR